MWKTYSINKKYMYEGGSMIYKKIQITVDGYEETADYTLIFWIIPLRCTLTENAR